MTDEEKVVLSVGDSAPDFTAKIQDDTEINLKSILEDGQKVLLVFYPGDDTPGCTAQLCGVRDVYAEYQELGVRVLGVNQGNQKSHQDFIDKYNYQFDIIVDEGRQIARSFGAMRKFFKNMITKRGAFLINTDGKISFIHWGRQDDQKIIEKLKNNQL